SAVVRMDLVAHALLSYVGRDRTLSERRRRSNLDPPQFIDASRSRQRRLLPASSRPCRLLQRPPRRPLRRVARWSSSSSFVPRLDRCLKPVEIHVFQVRAAQFFAVSFVESVETNGVEDLPEWSAVTRTRINVPSAVVLSTLNVMAMGRSL